MLDHLHNVVIIDYETAVVCDDHTHMEYHGGFMCWPMRLLECNVELYIPEPADDLLAGILVILHLLFPSHFDRFHASNIGLVETWEKTRLLKLWRALEQSVIWGPFVAAARGGDYKTLKNMADVFCYV